MRKDMGKIITEKPRGGSSARNAKTRMSIKWKGHDGDYDIPQKQSSSRFRIHGYDAKQFTDVLTPLYRYLDKQVGRPWNKVYSELCEFLDKRKVTHAHVFTHIDSHVEKDVYRGVDGHWHTRPYGGLVKGLYVHPKTGLIRVQELKDKEIKKDYDLYKIDDRNEYRRIDGVWYHVKLDMVWVDHYDYVAKKGYQKQELKQVSKKQLNSKELKKFGIENLKCTCYDNPKRAKYIDPKCPIHKEENK